MAKWISVKDRMPEKCGAYLIVADGKVGVARREIFFRDR